MINSCFKVIKQRYLAIVITTIKQTDHSDNVEQKHYSRLFLADAGNTHLLVLKPIMVKCLTLYWLLFNGVYTLNTGPLSTKP